MNMKVKAVRRVLRCPHTLVEIVPPAVASQLLLHRTPQALDQVELQRVAPRENSER
jgi:hypothetical protein